MLLNLGLTIPEEGDVGGGLATFGGRYFRDLLMATICDVTFRGSLLSEGHYFRNFSVVTLRLSQGI